MITYDKMSVYKGLIINYFFKSEGIVKANMHRLGDAN